MFNNYMNGLIVIFILYFIRPMQSGNNTRDPSQAVAFLARKGANLFDGHFCAGAIISNDIVLTSRTCIEQAHGKARNYVAIVGAKNVKSGGDGLQIIPWRKYIVASKNKEADLHSPADLHSAGRLKDLGVIRLEEKIKFENDVSSLTIAHVPVKGGENCEVFGWGNYKSGLKNDIERVKGTLLPSSNCAKKYPGEPIDALCCNELTDNPCKMDWGGPLVCNGLLYGVLKGPTHCLEKTSCVFTDTLKSKGFITYCITTLHSGCKTTVNTQQITINLFLNVLCLFIVK